MLTANPGLYGGPLKFPVLHSLAKRGDMKDLNVRGVSRGNCTSEKRNKSHSDSALEVKDLAGKLKRKTTARNHTGETYCIIRTRSFIASKPLVVPSGVPVIGQAQIVQRPSSPHASEIEPTVDEVIIMHY